MAHIRPDGWLDGPPNFNFARTASQRAAAEKAKQMEKFSPIPAFFNSKRWKAAKAGKDTDVRFKVQGQEFTAHKLKLMASSDYFKNMFSSPFVENTLPSTAIEMKDMDPRIFKELLKFIYTGTLGKKTQLALVQDMSKLVELMKQADYLQVEGFSYWAVKLVNAYFELMTLSIQRDSSALRELFVMALAERCWPLVRTLLSHFEEGHYELIEHSLPLAIGKASSDGLITKEVWEELAKLSTGKAAEVIRNCRLYNPFITQLYPEQ